MTDPSPEERHSGALSPEQIQIISLVGAGWTDERIARELGVSVSTVKRRLHAAARALKAVSRASLVLEAARRGVIGQPEGDT